MSQGSPTREEHNDLKTEVHELAKSIRELREMEQRDAVTFAEFKGTLNTYKTLVPILTLVIGLLVGLGVGHVAL